MCFLPISYALPDDIETINRAHVEGQIDTGWGWATSGGATGLWMNCYASPKSDGVDMTLKNYRDGVNYSIILDGRDHQYGAKLVQERPAGWYNAYNSNTTPITIKCHAWAYYIANSDLYYTIEIPPATKCWGFTRNLDLGDVMRGTEHNWTLLLFSYGGGRITVTSNDIDSNGVLRFQNNPEITVTPRSSLNIKNNTWITAGDTGIPLTVKIGNNARVTKFTSYLTAKITCD